jgi:hypothetical protein
MAPNQQRRTCSACGFENAPDAIHCAQCGIPLGSVTTVATPEVAALEELRPLAHPANLSANEVLFFIAGHVDPVIITLSPDTRKLLIGRGIDVDSAPDLDLVALSETAESVSRHHALLDFSGERPTITDLGSTNGTWLNENRLTPHIPRLLHNGDLLRLGQQFMFVYFASALDAAEIITLTDRAQSVPYLTPDSLVLLGAYFETLGAVQDICREARQQPLKKITIREMKVNQARELAKVRVADASAVLHLVADVVTPWRAQHQAALDQEPLPDEAWEELEFLTMMSLDELIPDKSEAERAQVLQQLLPHLRSIALHPLELSIADRWG